MTKVSMAISFAHGLHATGRRGDLHPEKLPKSCRCLSYKPGLTGLRGSLTIRPVPPRPIPVPSVELAPGIVAGAGGFPGFPVIAGPCVIESEGLVLETAHALAALAERLGISLIFKSS